MTARGLHQRNSAGSDKCDPAWIPEREQGVARQEVVTPVGGILKFGCAAQGWDQATKGVCIGTDTQQESCFSRMHRMRLFLLLALQVQLPL